MEIQKTKFQLAELVRQSETLKASFKAMVLIAPQVLDEEDVHELRDLTNALAVNFESMASYMYQFGRLTPSGNKYVPSNKICVEDIIKT
jgi:hypothetical protein